MGFSINATKAFFGLLMLGNGCCGFLGLFGRVLKVVLPNVLPVSVAGIFRGQHSVLWCSWLGSASIYENFEFS